MRYRARFVLPIASPPLHDGWVRVEGGRVRGVGTGVPLGPETDLGSVAVLPGLVNAHTHLELSYLHGTVPPAAEFIRWIRAVIDARRQQPDPRAPDIVAAIDRGIGDSMAAGTAVVGDISNTLVPFASLASTPMAGVVFHEVLKFNAPDPEHVVDRAVAEIRALPAAPHVRASLALHAPYSVAPAIFRCLRTRMDADPSLAPCSLHLSESRAEVEFVVSGHGPCRALLEDVGAWDPSWTAPGCTPVEYADAHGLLDSGMLLVHGVHMSAADLDIVRKRGATLVTCPRSNLRTGAGTPPIESFFASGVPIAIGTDSLASTPDLNVFSELAALRALAPSVPARRLLDSATRQGAHALGCGESYGVIAAGHRARLLVVSIPAAVDDVEEYLVNGITPDQIAWLD